MRMRRRKWIKGALGVRRRCYAKPGAHHRKRCRVESARRGALHRQFGVRRGRKIPLRKLRWAAKQPGKLGYRARLALTMRRFRGGR